MTTAMDTKDSYVETFRSLDESRGRGASEAWLRPMREAALERFAAQGFPTKRDEDWKFTNVSPIANTEFVRPSGEGGIKAEALEAYRLDAASCRLVFVDGLYFPKLSSADATPAGVKLGNLAQALEADGDQLEPYLARYADHENDAFTALNTAFLEDGGFLYVPNDVVVGPVLHFLFVSTESPEPTITHPRHLFIVEEGSQATIVEEYVSLAGGVHFSNVVTELVAGEGATVNHYLIERENEGSFNVGTLRIELGRNTNVASHSVLLGGRLVRNNVHPVLGGKGGHCLINGLFMPNGRQHIDNFMRVEHASPHCDSRQFYNGILDGHAHGVFSGRIVVHKDAQKTDAKQTNRNLLLSKEAQVDSKPQLEIYADDVKCTHGATIGQIDADSIFYLRSRGIPAAEARAMLLLAFAGENLERMEQDSVRAYAEAMVRERMPDAAVLGNGR